MNITVLANMKGVFVSVADSLSRHWPGSNQSRSQLLSNSQPSSSFSSSDLELQTSQSNSSPNNTTSQSQSQSPQTHPEPSENVNLQPQLPSATQKLPAPTIHEPQVNNTLDAKPDLEVELQKMLLNFCSTVAIQITIQYEQIAESKHTHSFNLLTFAVLFTFAALFVSQSIRKKCPKTSKALQKVGMIVAAASFVLTITIPFPMSVKFATWAICALTFLTTVICNCF